MVLCISMSNTLSPTDKMLDVQQAAEFLGVNPGTIRRWAQEKKVQALKVGVRGDWRFTQAALLQVGKTEIEQSLELPLARDAVLSHGPATHSNHFGQTGYSGHIGHRVQFYNDEKYLVASLRDYVVEGLRADETCVVIATKNHLRLLRKSLAADAVDTDGAVERGQLLLLDAHDTLQSFMKDEMPDPKLYRKVIGGLMGKLQQRGRPIRAYGEMVAILWNRGNQNAMLRLEELWNELAKTYDFMLLCGYPLAAFGQSDHGEAFAAITHRHTQVIPAESYTRVADPQEHYRSIALLQQKAQSLDHEMNIREQAVKACLDSEIKAYVLAAEQERLLQLNQAKDEFISIASHQLRTPATGVKQYVGMLLEGYFGELSPDQFQYLSKAYDSNERQIKVINDLLLIAKVDAGNIHLSSEEYDLSRLIADVIEEQRSEIARRGQSIKLEVPASLPAYIDPQYMRMVIENLVSNASKYSTDGKVITIIAKRTSGEVHISVRDQGIGISAQDQQKLYKKFSRIYNDQSVAEGNGLGLYWSKKIVELHGGTLELQSHLGRGSTFTISLSVIA